MALWMEFKGIRNTSLGLRLTELPNRYKPAARGSRIVVPGRDGDLWLPDGGYENIKLTVSMKMVGHALEWATISDWLIGSGKLVLSDDPAHCYRARIVQQYEYERQLPYRADHRSDDFTVTFDCQPFRYLAAPQTYTLSKAGVITNPSAIPAEPLMQVNGSGDIAIYIGRNSLHISDLTSQIYIDSEAKFAYSPSGTLLTGSLTGDWPMLEPGHNDISFSGDASGILIQPNWKWL